MENWVSKLAADGMIRKPPEGMIYFLIVHGAGSLFVFPGLAARLYKSAAKPDPKSIRKQAEQVIGVFLEGLLPR
jgi:hypothetical protein